MTTAEAIEGITDAGKFEILATRVLRIEESDCQALEHMGVNSSGKTIANPIDGFCLVPGSTPPRFVMAAFTTEATVGLRRKWLFDHTTDAKSTPADDGDLVKASRWADKLRQANQDAQFVLYLCSNRRLDIDLMNSVYADATRRGIEVRLLPQSRFRDCLDTKPEGQWLRKEHLGIEADLLSPSLLQHIGQKSLALYAKDFLVTPVAGFVRTSVQETLLEAARTSTQTVHVLRGRSGSGKSVVSYQVLQDHLKAGGFGLRIPGEVAARALSLSNAIDNVLHSIHPAIETNAGERAMAMATPERRLVVIVDDVNRGGSPNETVTKILGWGNPSLSGSSASDSVTSCVIVVPVWEIVWSPSGKIIGKKNWLANVPVREMSEDEAIRCLDSGMGKAAVSLSVAERRRICDALGRDPILIAMYAENCNRQSEFVKTVSVHDVMQAFVQSHLEKTARVANTPACELEVALLELAENMLCHRDLYPQWTTVKTWLPADQVKSIGQLVTQDRVCRTSQHSGQERFEFRHDRILEYFLTQMMAKYLNDPDRYTDVISDPYYSAFVGSALAEGSKTEALLTWIRNHAPLALIASLHQLSPRDVSAARVAQYAKQWLSEAAANRQQTPPSLLYEVYRLLEDIDSPFVLDVTESLARHRLIARARLANGDAGGGVVEFSDTHMFAPGTNDHQLETVLERALYHHREVLVSGCRTFLRMPDLSLPELEGALTLAGFIGSPDLAADIAYAWQTTLAKQDMLVAGLWAASRCGSGDPNALLGPMLHEWRNLSDESPNGGYSAREGIATQLRFAMWRWVEGISDVVLNYLVAVARSDESLKSSIVYLIEHVDHPIVVRYLVEVMAESEQRARQKGDSSFWNAMLLMQWDPAYGTHAYRLSGNSRSELRRIWEGENEDVFKEMAFRVWVRASDNVAELQSVSSDHPHFNVVARRRAMLGDQTIAPYVRSCLDTDTKWLEILNHVWCQDFAEPVDQSLAALKDTTPTDYSGGQTNMHYTLANLLRDIPTLDGETLLLKHWDCLKYSPLFIQAALYIGTEQLLPMATEAIAGYPPSIDVFEYIGSFFGFITFGLRDHLTLAHLERLIPYLQELSDMDVSTLATHCRQDGYYDWVEQYLHPEIDRRRSELSKASSGKQEHIERIGRYDFPTDSDLLDDLNVIAAGKWSPSHMWFWCEGFDRRKDRHDRWRRILEEWLQSSPSLRRLEIVASGVASFGNRGDLELLTRWSVTGDTAKVEQIIADAQFAVMRRTLK